MRWIDVIKLAKRWPEVNEAISYGEPSLKVRKRLLARYRVADNSVVLLDVPAEERDHLIEIMPDVFFCEPHYDDHSIVLANLEHAVPKVIERILERRWRSSATKRSIAEYEG